MKNDPVSYGIYIGEKILNAIKHCDSKQGEGRQSVQESAQKIGVVRRAVDFPSLMLSLGIKAAYVFYLSKSKVFEKGNQKKFYDIYQYIASTED
nr:hypothetical protein [Caldisphaeraceae archaeon]